jgi:hypothetical protein
LDFSRWLSCGGAGRLRLQHCGFWGFIGCRIWEYGALGNSRLKREFREGREEIHGLLLDYREFNSKYNDFHHLLTNFSEKHIM